MFALNIMLEFVPDNEPPCFWFQLRLAASHAVLFLSSFALFTLFYMFEAKINEWGNQSKAYVLDRVDRLAGCCWNYSEPSRNNVASAPNNEDVVELQRLNAATMQESDSQHAD